MSFLLEVKNLCKHFGSLKAVDGISLGIRPGICFGLLGPNGAGKTTTIEMIEGITTPTKGQILYKGKSRDHNFSQQMGIQFQSTALQDYLSVREVLHLFHSFYHTPVEIDQLISQCELSEIIDQEANKLSGGQKQRLLLALALINDPDIVFLDEPTTGLDPQSRRGFWQLISKAKNQGKTIILTTHYMDEAELLCDELVIIDHGKIIDQGSPRQLLDKHLPHKRVCLASGYDHLITDQLSGSINTSNNSLEITTTCVEKSLQELINLGADLSTLKVRNPTLEDLFIQLTGRQFRE